MFGLARGPDDDLLASISALSSAPATSARSPQNPNNRRDHPFLPRGSSFPRGASKFLTGCLRFIVDGTRLSLRDTSRAAAAERTFAIPARSAGSSRDFSPLGSIDTRLIRPFFAGWSRTHSSASKFIRGRNYCPARQRGFARRRQWQKPKAAARLEKSLGGGLSQHAWNSLLAL